MEPKNDQQTPVFYLPQNDAQGTSAEPLVGAGSLDSQFEAFQRVVAQHPMVFEPSVCTKSAFAKGVNWVRLTSRQMGGCPGTSRGGTTVVHSSVQGLACVVPFRCSEAWFIAHVAVHFRKLYSGNHRFVFVIPHMLHLSALSNERTAHVALSRRPSHCCVFLVQVRSRGFTVLGDPHMIPGADMFNHDPNKQSVQIGTDGDDHFVMKTVSW